MLAAVWKGEAEVVVWEPVACNAGVGFREGVRHAQIVCEPLNNHACLTGDCEHENANECLDELRVWAAEVWWRLNLIM